MPENIKAVANDDKSSGRNWTDAEKDLVWEQVIKGKSESLPLTECFRRTSRLLPHRSEAAIGMLYYNVLRKERDEKDIPKPKPTQTQQPKRELKLDSELIEAFQGLPEYIAALHKRIDQLEEKLNNPDQDAIVASLLKIFSDYQKHDSTLKLQTENRQLQERITKLNQAYEDALGIYDMFTNMASISQIMSLGDFKQQMKTTLDKWGNVLQVKFERAD